MCPERSPTVPVPHRTSGGPAAGLANPLFQEGGRTRPPRRQLSRHDIGHPNLLSSTAAPRDAKTLGPCRPAPQVRELSKAPAGAAPWPGWEGGLSPWVLLTLQPPAPAPQVTSPGSPGQPLQVTAPPKATAASQRGGLSFCSWGLLSDIAPRQPPPGLTSPGRVGCIHGEAQATDDGEGGAFLCPLSLSGSFLGAQARDLGLSSLPTRRSQSRPASLSRR